MPGLQTRGSRTAGKADTSGGGKPTASDERADRARRRQRDAPLQRAFEAGRRGDDPAEFQTDDELAGYYDEGRSFARTEARAGRRAARGEQLRSQAGAAGASAGRLANDGAGFLLGLFAYALLANYLRHGIPGVKGWLAAKFLNQPSATLGPDQRPGARGVSNTEAGQALGADKRGTR